MICLACNKPLVGNGRVLVIRKGQPDQEMHIACGLVLVPAAPKLSGSPDLLTKDMDNEPVSDN